MGEKRARREPHSECLHNGIILIVYIFKFVIDKVLRQPASVRKGTKKV